MYGVWRVWSNPCEVSRRAHSALLNHRWVDTGCFKFTNGD
jgi:hypothetical protein